MNKLTTECHVKANELNKNNYIYLLFFLNTNKLHKSLQTDTNAKHIKVASCVKMYSFSNYIHTFLNMNEITDPLSSPQL